MLRKDFEDLDTNGAVGDWCFMNDDTYICVRFGPDPMLDVAVLPLTGPKSWSWDGNREAPTLSPSIQVLPNRWHGYLRNGRLETI